MNKKSLILVVICSLLLLMTMPAMAILKVLDPAVSEELRTIAVNHLAKTQNIAPEAITIDNSWVREFWNLKVDVYLIEAVIDQGMAGEQKIQVPVRVDQKAVLTPADFQALEEEDNRIAASEPQARILKANQEAVPAETTNYTAYYATALVLVALAGMMAIMRMRRKA